MRHTGCMTHATIKNTDSLFRPAQNCHVVSEAEYATVLVDCANYYEALHEAISRAKHSIFVLGWDIDGRIKLLRDEAAEHVRVFDLIQWKARQNPDLQIFLNRWDYSLFMANDREALGSWRWRRHSPDNVHYVLDGAVPMGACHHQKIVVIDDEVAFCGGMDLALNRWDRRSHMPSNHHRIDPGALDNELHRFGPYHDIQMVVAGPVVEHLARIVRQRWSRVTEVESIPLRVPADGGAIPAAWPPSAEPQFCNAPIAISQTLPQWDEVPQTEHIVQMYLDMIGQAEQFIYMENQFFAYEAIAKALNKRLHERPELRVLLVSSYNPNGLMEKKALWHGRVRFRDIIEAGGVADRVTLAHPLSRTNGQEKPIRIHSKLMVVDDRYLRIGSSNINNRSMHLDTECDLVIEAQEEDTQARAAIRSVRNDLIREHTGQEVENIERVINEGKPPSEFLNYLSHSRQHLRKINDEPYRHERFTRFARAVADPVKPLIPVSISMALSKTHIVRILLVVIAVAALALAWKYTPLAHYANPETVVPMFEQVRNTAWAVPAAMAFYTIGTLLFFPHMAMTAIIVLVFAPLQAFSIAMVGSLLSGTIGFFIGHKLGLNSLRALVGNSAEKISAYAKKGGLMGVTLLRLLPVAPYTVVNLALGMLEVTYMTFMLGTFLGTLPGTAIAAYLGNSVMETWQNPSDENFGLLAGGLAAWVAIVAASHFAGRWWRKRHGISHDHKQAKAGV